MQQTNRPNQYGIEVPEGKPEYPSQEFVDDFLNRIDDAVTCSDLQKLRDMGEEKAKEYIQKEMNALTAKVEGFFSTIQDSIERKMTPIEPLITPPGANLGALADYCSSLVSYFTDPYTRLAEMAIWYTSFGVAAASALENKVSDLGCLVSGGGTVVSSGGVV